MSSEFKPLFSDSIQKGDIVGERNNRILTRQIGKKTAIATVKMSGWKIKY
jgi:hypothetical protein